MNDEDLRSTQEEEDLEIEEEEDLDLEVEDSGDEETGGAPDQSTETGELNVQEEETESDESETSTGNPVGIDIGTENLIVAKKEGEGVKIGHQRNAFIEVPNDEFTHNMIEERGISYAEQDGNLYILGNAAFELSQIFDRDPQRPMDRGVLSPEETDAIPIITMFLEKLIGRTETNEKAVFSIPADPVDTDFDAKFHEEIFNEILSDLGYDSQSIYEGHAVALSELEEEDFTGVAASFGAGMTNCCISYQSIPAVVFSTSRGGRWIDEKASQVSGITQSRVTAIKERGMDLQDPQDRVEKGISIYYRELLTWTLENIAQKFKEQSETPSFTRPVPLVASGGTSSIDGFQELFAEIYEEVGFPLEISEIRVADDPLNSVCRGCLVSAQIS